MKEERPWGWYEVIDQGDRFKVKNIEVKPGHRLSLQKHHHRTEHWIVVSGTAEVQLNDARQLIGENIRLEQEVQDLRSLEIVNQELQLQLESYESISTVSNVQNFELLSSGFITKNLNLEYLIYGGTNQQLEVGDLVINEKGFVVGYLREVFYSYSILESPYSSDFNLEVMDKYNNTYLITSNGSEMFISSILLDNYKDDIDFLYTDISFNHSGKFPVVDTRLINFEFQNNQINASVKFLDSFTFNTKLFIPKFK